MIFWNIILYFLAYFEAVLGEKFGVVAQSPLSWQDLAPICETFAGSTLLGNNHEESAFRIFQQ